MAGLKMNKSKHLCESGCLCRCHNLPEDLRKEHRCVCPKNMNKSKLREQVEASITGTFNRLVFAEKKNGKQNYCVHDDIDNCMDTIEEIRESVRNIVNYALKAQKSELLEEVRNIIGEDEKFDYSEGDDDKENRDLYIGAKIGRSKLRAELRQKLSILEGKK